MNIEWKRLIHRYQEFIGPIVLIVVSILGLIVGVIPAGRKVFGNYFAMQTVGKQVNALQNKAHVLETMDETLVRSQLQGLLDAIPSDKSPGTLLLTAEGTATQNNLSLSDISLVAPGSLATESAVIQSAQEKKLGSTLLPFTMTLDGTLLQFRNFLETAQSVRRLLRVNSFSLNFTPIGTKALVTMQAFYAPFPVGIGSVDTPLSDFTDKEKETLATILQLPQMVVPVSTQPTSGKENPFSR